MYILIRKINEDDLIVIYEYYLFEHPESRGNFRIEKQSGEIALIDEIPSEHS